MDWIHRATHSRIKPCLLYTSEHARSSDRWQVQVPRRLSCFLLVHLGSPWNARSEEHTSELQSRETISYAVFWKNFGAVMKEGPVEDYANRDAVLKLLRFASCLLYTSRCV